MDDLKPEAGGNVVDIKKGAKGKNRTNKSGEKATENKLKLPQVYLAISDAINRSPLSLLVPFPLRLAVLEPEKGKRLPVMIGDDDEVQIVGRSFVTDAIIRYTATELALTADFLIGPKQAAEATAYWMAMATPLDADSIRYTRFQGMEGLTYRRLPWAYQTGPTPTWDDLLSRMTNAKAFTDWVGSLFFEQSNSHNYVWIYGEGGDGKGTINRFFMDVFGVGKSYQSKTAPSCDKKGAVDKFWAFNLLTARLAAFPDCDSPTFPTSGLFKSITGGDPIPMEAKGGLAFTATVNARCLILANCQPAITGARSNTRRIIYCEMGPTDKSWKGVQEKLWEEGGYFLSTCILQYITKYPEHEPLQTDQTKESDALAVILAENEQHFETFFHSFFALNANGVATAGDIVAAANEVWPGKRKPYWDFLEWLKRTYGVKCEIVKASGKSERHYAGIVRKVVAIKNKASMARYDNGSA